MSFAFGKVFEPFIKERPIAVMARAALENLLDPARIEGLFERTAEVQYTRELMFSSVVDLMGQVVLGVQPSIHAAYQAQAEKLGVSDQAVYDKLNRVEPCVSAELVCDSARKAGAVIRSLRAKLTIACTLIVGGVLLNRLNVFVVGYRPPVSDAHYFPSVGEIMITVGLIAGLMLLYRFLITHLPVLNAPEKEVPA